MTIATTLFLSKGYNGVSVDEIIKEVGGSKTNLYSQFGGKEGVFHEVVKTMCDDFLSEFKAINVLGKDIETGLKILASRLLEILLQDAHIAFQRLVIAESGRFPGLGRIWLERGPQQTRQIIAQFIESRQKELTLPGSDVMRIATQFHDMITTNPMHLAMFGVPMCAADIEVYIDEAVWLVVHGLSKAHPEALARRG